MAYLVRLPEDIMVANVALLLQVFLLGCSGTRTSVEGTLLDKFLTSEDRNGIFWAASYCHANGGPELPDPSPESLDDWVSLRQVTLSWLRQQEPEEMAKLARGFPQYVTRQSPMFPPWKESGESGESGGNPGTAPCK